MIGPESFNESPDRDALRHEAVQVLEAALTMVHDRCRVNFGGYRRATLERRLANRMVAAGTPTGDAYLRLLRGSDHEIDALAANLTIKVSRFYRNPEVFDFLARHAIPQLRARFDEPLRIWSAGCATGEEAYTLAALVSAKDRVVGTDIDPRALQTAREARYPLAAFDEAPRPLIDAITVADDTLLRIDDEVRKRVNFFRHDLTSSPAAEGPFHLISCRNVLIYFSPALQAAAMELLVAQLVPGGVLCLGEAEWPCASVAGSLEELHRKNKIFRHVAEETLG